MKPLFAISCPIDTYYGYGARSRDLVKSLIDSNKYRIKILPQKWGNCPWGFIEDHSEWEFLNEHLVKGNQLDKKPDIWAQITVPNEFQPLGIFNIGITAGIETTLCRAEWIEGMNRMDLNIVPSNHSKKVFEDTSFEKRDNNNNILGEVKLQKPVEVVFEGINLDVYKHITPSQITFNLDDIKENFAYLFVGHWMQGDMGEDRKNVGLLIRSFYELFKNKPKAPALILKTSGAGACYMDREFILNKIHAIKESVEAQSFPSIYLLHGELEDSEMNELYNHPKVKAMVSLTKGEGFGRPLLEFTQSKKPIIATNWSGHTDFLHKKFVSLIEGNLTPVHQSAVNDWILKESHWFTPNMMEIGHYLNNVFVNYKPFKENAKKQAGYAKNRFSLNKMKELLVSLIDQYSPEFVEEVELVLPELQPLELPKLETL